MRLRRARFDEADLILGWRNDPLSRKMSPSARPVSRAEHTRWWAHRWRDVRIAETDATEVGYWRADEYSEVPGGCLVSVAVAPEWRGLGMAAPLIRLGTRSALRKYRTCVALVRHENLASVRAFSSVGYKVWSVSKEGGRLMIEMRKERRS